MSDAEPKPRDWQDWTGNDLTALFDRLFHPIPEKFHGRTLSGKIMKEHIEAYRAWLIGGNDE